MYRITWKHSPEFVGPWDKAPSKSVLENLSTQMFKDVSMVGTPSPVFYQHPAVLRAGTLGLLSNPAEHPELDLSGYQQVFVDSMDAAAKLQERLANTRGVSAIQLQPRPAPARYVDANYIAAHAKYVEALEVRPGAPKSFVNLQGYLDPAPQGVGARAAWHRAGGNGAGVTVVDIEYGWNFEHEDLVKRQLGVIHGPNVDDDHGTAVLGIYSGDKNGVGVTGIAWGARAAAASAGWDYQAEKWNAADAIRAVLKHLKPGDVILLEMHAPGPRASGSGQEGYIPVEYWAPERAMIELAIRSGVHVVEAGGNGGENLDHPDYDGRLSRLSGDSGAILVGGGKSPRYQGQERSRCWWSNFGSRLDVQGWGEDIVTTGGRSDSSYCDLVENPVDPNRCYTQSFGGTSGASPIVAGVVACLEGALRASGRPPLAPSEMRALLVETGTPQNHQGGPKEPIGPLPDLAKAFAKLGL